MVPIETVKQLNNNDDAHFFVLGFLIMEYLFCQFIGYITKKMDTLSSCHTNIVLRSYPYIGLSLSSSLSQISIVYM